MYDADRGVLYDPTSGEAVGLDRPKDDPKSGFVVEHDVSVKEAVREAELSGKRLPEPGQWQEVGKGGQAAREEAEKQSKGQ